MINILLSDNTLRPQLISATKYVLQSNRIIKCISHSKHTYNTGISLLFDNYSKKIKFSFNKIDNLLIENPAILSGSYNNIILEFNNPTDNDIIIDINHPFLIFELVNKNLPIATSNNPLIAKASTVIEPDKPVLQTNLLTDILTEIEPKNIEQKHVAVLESIEKIKKNDKFLEGIKVEKPNAILIENISDPTNIIINPKEPIAQTNILIDDIIESNITVKEQKQKHISKLESIEKIKKNDKFLEGIKVEEINATLIENISDFKKVAINPKEPVAQTNMLIDNIIESKFTVKESVEQTSMPLIPIVQASEKISNIEQPESFNSILQLSEVAISINEDEEKKNEGDYNKKMLHQNDELLIQAGLLLAKATDVPEDKNDKLLDQFVDLMGKNAELLEQSVPQHKETSDILSQTTELLDQTSQLLSAEVPEQSIKIKDNNLLNNLLIQNNELLEQTENIISNDNTLSREQSDNLLDQVKKLINESNNLNKENNNYKEIYNIINQTTELLEQTTKLLENNKIESGEIEADRLSDLLENNDDIFRNSDTSESNSDPLSDAGNALSQVKDLLNLTRELLDQSGESIENTDNILSQVRSNPTAENILEADMSILDINNILFSANKTMNETNNKLNESSFELVNLGGSVEDYELSSSENEIDIIPIISSISDVNPPNLNNNLEQISGEDVEFSGLEDYSNKLQTLENETVLNINSPTIKKQKRKYVKKKITI